MIIMELQVHIVDKGIDTGAIIAQEKANFSNKDNFNTYLIHQLHTAKDLLIKSIDIISMKKF